VNLLWLGELVQKLFFTPHNVGIPIGGRIANNLVLQIHYDNPEGEEGLIDSSGVILFSTPHKRQFDGGLFVLGSTINRISIPPRLPEFDVPNTCLNNCSAPIFSVYFYALHMHLIGKKMKTELWRNGVHITNIGNETQWDFNRQEQVVLEKEIEIRNGDTLITTCTYDSTNRTTITRGGFPTTSEMCFNYVGYYPKQLGFRSCIGLCRR